MSKAIVMAGNDNVATALQRIRKGSAVELIDKHGNSLPAIVAEEDIPAGNKIALVPLAKGAPLIKYGVVVGEIYRPVAAGHFVHVHNAKSNRINIPGPIVVEILRQMGYTQEEESHAV